ELGRSLAPSPLLATAIAATAILATEDDEVQRRLLPRMAAGGLTATVAGADEIARRSQGAPRATAVAGGWVLDGTCSSVIDGVEAQAIVVLATADDRPGLFLVEDGTPGLERRAL